MTPLELLSIGSDRPETFEVLYPRARVRFNYTEKALPYYIVSDRKPLVPDRYEYRHFVGDGWIASALAIVTDGGPPDWQDKFRISGDGEKALSELMYAYLKYYDADA